MYKECTRLKSDWCVLNEAHDFLYASRICVVILLVSVKKKDDGSEIESEGYSSASSSD